MKFFNVKDKHELLPPKHIAIIMDGNYRWSKLNNLSLQEGHKKGAENIENICDASIEIGIKYLTIYAFSSENWQRPIKEVEYLMALLDDYIDKYFYSLQQKNIKILISGDLSKLSKKTQNKIKNIEIETDKNDALTLNVAFSYGGRQEIIDSVKKIASQIANGKMKIQDINQNNISQNLYQPSIPDPDLIIRTGGDFRISNFLLWQSAYSEFFFTNILWPDFSKKDLQDAVNNFNKRERRYGKR